MNDFYVTTVWDSQFGRRDIQVYDYEPINSDVRVVGPIKATNKVHALRKFKRFIKTGYAD